MDLSVDHFSCGTVGSISSDSDSQKDSAEYNPLVSPLTSPKQDFRIISMCSPIFLIFVTGVLFGGVCTLGLKKSIDLTAHAISHLRGEDILNESENEAKKIILSSDGSTDQPKISWLLSFPNSGTSYTSKLVKIVTGYKTASNYFGAEHGRNVSGFSTPVFPVSTQGPFWTDPNDDRFQTPSRGYVLTKSHCGARCASCKPDDYIENHHLFLKDCLKTEYIMRNGNGGVTKMKGHYDKKLVSRAIHLIRDPFDNIVSRFHLAHKHSERRKELKFLAKYPKSKEGFRDFCKDIGMEFRSEEKHSKFFDDFFDEVKNVPCYADFFKYLQWHNLAFTTTWDLGIPTMILHYENYTYNFNGTKDSLLEFLEQEDNHDPPDFIRGKTYRHYFSKEEVQAVFSMLSKVALQETWIHTKHYFD
mmetsp:Transcript_5953/g.12210  ORF Transcript_5953/g.12210 Transcript_5953/m.12210 type:complete len:416 (+) Transcript_5953:190-1437(+)